MRVLSVPSKSLFNVHWIDLTVYTFSPREVFALLIGGLLVGAAIASMIHPLGAVVGVGAIAFGFFPFGFIAPEKQVMAFLDFHFGSKTGKPKKVKSSFLGVGAVEVHEQTETQEESSEHVSVSSLEIPYTLKIKTSAKSQFIPVSIFFYDGDDSLHIASVSTLRNGFVSCTFLLDKYGKKTVRVIGDDGTVYYDKGIIFEEKT